MRLLLICCLLFSGLVQGNLVVASTPVTQAGSVRTDVTRRMEPEVVVDTPGPHKLIERGGTVWVEPTPTPIQYVGSFSARERKLFERIVSAEAGPTWGYRGYLLLAQVTVNQWLDGSWGDTLGGVLKHPDNYSVYSNGRYLEVTVSEYAVKAVEVALAGKKGRILYYCTESQYRKKGFHYHQKWITTYRNVMFFGKGD